MDFFRNRQKLERRSVLLHKDSCDAPGELVIPKTSGTTVLKNLSSKIIHCLSTAVTSSKFPCPGLKDFGEGRPLSLLASTGLG